MFATPFKNGKTYGDCFPNKGIGIRQNYPYFDDKAGKVITLELALNLCREANGEKPYSYTSDDMAALTAYMAFTSRGKPFDIKIPNDPRALAAYENGKKYFYQRRGQLNFSCASCHVQSPGERIRTEVLAPALGILAAMPIYRSEWGGMGTISRRFVTCNSQVRGVPLEPQDDLYRDVEYYLSYMSNGLPICGPGRAPVRPEEAMRKHVLIPLAIALSLAGVAVAAAAGTRGRFQVRLGGRRSRQQGSGRAQEPMDHDRADAGGGQDRPRRPREYRQGHRSSPSRPRRSPKHRSIRPRSRKRPGRRPSFAERTQPRESVRVNRREASEASRRCGGVGNRSAASARLPTTTFTTSAASATSRVLHLTDTHAQLLPVYFREPSVNLGIGAMRASRRIWSAAPFSSISASKRAARARTPSPSSITRRRRIAMAAWAASPISRL